MPTERNRPKRDCFNRNAQLPFQLRLEDFEIAMQDVYDLFYDVNTGLLEKGLERLADFVYNIDNETEPARQRRPLSFSEVYLGQVTIEDFRRNPRGELGTRTATLHREGILKLRSNWIYKDPATSSTS